MAQSVRPRDICKALLAALDAAEGRRKRRKRDQTPDAIGLGIKRELLERAVEADPPPETFEQWLLDYPMTYSAPELAGATGAMARAVFDEWRLAHSLDDFKKWLDQGAPSEDVANPDEKSSHTNVREVR
ncbi:MAG TPA: hypothetical protein VGL11_01270 [Candidatus Binatia bacterium]|jgi:hypothetical protein